jgi:hypothetical protein
MAIGGIGFLAWIYIARISDRVFPKLKKNRPGLYNRIIAANGQSWLERGWFSPLDAATQIRLYRAIYRGDAGDLLSRRSHRVYVWSLRIFVLAESGFVVGGIFLVVCFSAL